MAVLTALTVWWNLALIAEFSTQLMDRQRLELKKNAYDAFVTIPRMAPGLAYRYLTRRETFYQPRPAGGAERGCASSTCGHPVSVEAANRLRRGTVMRWRARQSHLIVRPDTHTPARDPFDYYCLAPAGPSVAARPRERTQGRHGPDPWLRSRRSAGSGRADCCFTRDLSWAR